MCDLCMLWQQFRHATQDLKMQGKVLFLVESKYFDATKKAKADAAAMKKWKAVEQEAGGTQAPQKQARTAKNVSAACIEPFSGMKNAEGQGDGGERERENILLTAPTPTPTAADPITQTPSSSGVEESDLCTAQASGHDEASRLFKASWRVEYEKVPVIETREETRRTESRGG